MQHTDTQFPARHLFRLVARGMAGAGVAFASPMGRRSVSDCRGGTFEGARLAGQVVPTLGNEYRLQSPEDASLQFLEGLITLQASTGETILLTYRGRRSARYGAASYRVGITLEADGAVDWLNDLHAVGYAHIEGEDLRLEVFELLGRPAPDATFLDVEPLYRMSARGSIGTRHKIHGPLADRYFSVAERGCTVQGAIAGDWLEGFAWGPHRMGRTDNTQPWHIDMRVTMRTTDGTPLIQQYMGAIARTAPAPDADRSWRTTAIYETDAAGPLGWLNGIVSAGIGWSEANEAHYFYYTLL